MQWDKQTQASMNGWFGTQQKLFENWWNLLATPPADPQPPFASMPTMDWWFSNGLEQWRTFAQQGAAAFMPELTDMSRTTLEQFFASQQHVQHLMQMTMEAWNAVMSGAASPEEWQQALNQYMEQMRKQMATSIDVYKLAQSATELWQLYNQEMTKLSQPWFNYWLQTQQQLGRAVSQQEGPSTWVGLTNLFWDTFNQTTGRLMGVPSMGLMREFNEKISNGFTTWQENQRAGIEYQLLIGNTWVDAFEAFLEKLLSMARTGETIDSQDKFIDLWVEVADEQFLTLFHSDTFAQVQSRYINSSMTLRRQQRELTEVGLRMNDLPTSSEIDEAHHAIYLLRQEVKALKKSLHEIATETASQKAKTEAPVKTSATRTTRAKATTEAPDKVEGKVLGKAQEGSSEKPAEEE